MKKVTAFQSTDGSLFRTHRDAAEHDARTSITAILRRNLSSKSDELIKVKDDLIAAVVEAIMADARAIVSHLTPLYIESEDPRQVVDETTRPHNPHR